MFGNVSLFWKTLNVISLLPVYLIMYTVTYTFSKYCFEELTQDNAMSQAIHIIAAYTFYFCVIMSVITHTRILLINPGGISKDFIEKMRILNKDMKFDQNGYPMLRFQDDTIDNNLNKETSKLINGPENIEDKDLIQLRKKNPFYCLKCKIWRPYRAHHCSHCNTCFLVLDHHCPWVANCIGYYNHKLYFQFIVYAALADLIAFIYLIDKFQRVDKELNNYIQPLYPNGIPTEGLTSYEVMTAIKDPILIFIGALISAVMTGCIGALVIMQFKQLFKGNTCIEEVSNIQVFGCYNTNSKYENFKSLMGNSIFEWLNPFGSVPEFEYKCFKPFLNRIVEFHYKNACLVFEKEF